MSFKDIFHICENECQEGSGNDILLKIFKAIENRYDKKQLCQVFENSNMDLKEFIGNKDLEMFLRKNVSYILMLFAAFNQIANSFF